MGRIGAHVSISGGISLSIARALSLGCEAFQVFTRNQRQWGPKPLDDEQIISFKEELLLSQMGPVVSHGSYLINPAAPEETVRQRSIDAMVDELSRCYSLGIDRLVIHPGSHKGAGSKKGIETIASTIDEAFEKLDREGPMLLLETTAGQGTGIGSRFEDLSKIIDTLSFRERIGVCLDTAHMHAAGYNLTTPDSYSSTIEELDSLIGAESVKCIHLNDSKKELGSKVDRHDNLGDGTMGLVPFEMLVNEKRFMDVPMILETPGGDESYMKNLKLLREMRT